MPDWPYQVKIVVGLALAALSIYGGALLTSGILDQQNLPNIVLRKVAYFWIEKAKDNYEIGSVIRLYNLGQRAYVVRGVSLAATQPTFYGRGQSYLRTILLTGAAAEVGGDSFMKPSSDTTYKLKLPLNLGVSIVHPPPFGISFVGRWSIRLQKNDADAEAELSGTYDQVISAKEWDDLLTPKSKIDADLIDFAKREFPASSLTKP